MFNSGTGVLSIDANVFMEFLISASSSFPTQSTPCLFESEITTLSSNGMLGLSVKICFNKQCLVDAAIKQEMVHITLDFSSSSFKTVSSSMDSSRSSFFQRFPKEVAPTIMQVFKLAPKPAFH
ncbi:hypothetical protein V6N13_000630 [Hibiscus sabdariffa]